MSDKEDNKETVDLFELLQGQTPVSAGEIASMLAAWEMLEESFIEEYENMHAGDKMECGGFCTIMRVYIELLGQARSHLSLALGAYTRYLHDTGVSTEVEISIANDTIAGDLAKSILGTLEKAAEEAYNELPDDEDIPDKNLN